MLRGLVGSLPFLLWGALPVFWKQLSHVPSVEVLAHRVLWSLVLIALLLGIKGRFCRIRHAIQPKVLFPMLLAGSLLGCNWGMYIWAVNSGHVLSASLGYYVSPVITALLGVIILRERPGASRLAAFFLAFLGVCWFVYRSGTAPWIALGIGGSFSFYTLIRKRVALGSLEGIFLECLLLLPAALIWIYRVEGSGEGHFVDADGTTRFLLICTGAVTLLPLWLFLAVSRNLEMNLIGILQYIAPSITFVLGVFLYDEPFTLLNGVTFLFVWLALAVDFSGAIRRWAGPGRCE